MLLSSSKSLLAENDGNTPFTGEVSKADTAIAVVPIYLIKQANVKMIEREYLLHINNGLDSIIDMKNSYIKEQQFIIGDFQRRLNDANTINAAIRKDLNVQKKRTKIVACGAGGTILGLLIGLIAK